jgi:hypothetical protein
MAVPTVASSSSSPQLDTQEIAREVEQIALECRRYLFPERQRITESQTAAFRTLSRALRIAPQPQVPGLDLLEYPAFRADSERGARGIVHIVEPKGKLPGVFRRTRRQTWLSQILPFPLKSQIS